jgi:hypothetical protein
MQVPPFKKVLTEALPYVDFLFGNETEARAALLPLQPPAGTCPPPSAGSLDPFVFYCCNPATARWAHRPM